MKAVPLLKADSTIEKRRMSKSALRKSSNRRGNRASDIIQGALARLLFLCHSVIGVLLVIGMSSALSFAYSKAF